MPGIALTATTISIPVINAVAPEEVSGPRVTETDVARITEDDQPRVTELDPPP